MKPFAALMEALAFEPSRHGKLALMVAYLKATPDPDRGYALAALCGQLVFHGAKPALLRALIAERTDPVLFRISYDFVGDLSETIALMWPAGAGRAGELRLADVIDVLSRSGKSIARTQLEVWLDTLDETGRWALLKLITGSLRIGVSAGLAKQALALLGAVETSAIEDIWHGVEPPYRPLFDWLEGRAGRPETGAALTFHSPMLAHPLDEADLETLQPADFAAEWKWDGIRVQIMARHGPGGDLRVRLFSRTGEDIGAAFPDLVDRIALAGVVDGELVIADPAWDGAGAPRSLTFNDLQQRLNRKDVTAAQMRDLPAHLIAYDLLFVEDSAADGTVTWTDLRPEPFAVRRARLEALGGTGTGHVVSLSPQLAFGDFEELARMRAQSAEVPALEGVMLKRRDSPYLAGRPKGYWYKWKREPHLIDCVLMYAQRGHGKRSSLYSDFTFGLWRDAVLLPVGKAYFGFTDAELAQIDRFVRQNTVNRFGPVREVIHTAEAGLVVEVAFEGVQQSARHKSGLAMRFPRIHRLRWDKRPAEADQLSALARLARGSARPG